MIDFSLLNPGTGLASRLLGQSGPAQDATIFGSNTFLFILMTAGAGLAAASCVWYIRSSISPFEDIIQQARRLDPRNLGQRIVSPSNHPQVKQLVEVINGRLERLEMEFKNQQRFFSRVSHELRTPLSGLMMESKAIREKLPADSSCTATT